MKWWTRWRAKRELLRNHICPKHMKEQKPRCVGFGMGMPITEYICDDCIAEILAAREKKLQDAKDYLMSHLSPQPPKTATTEK